MAERLDLCKRCLHCERDIHRGILCGFTREKPEFDEKCPDFNLDPHYIPVPGTVDPNTVDLHFTAYETALKKQNYVLGTCCGMAVGMLCASMWPALAVLGGIFFLALPFVMGAAVGLTIRYTGRAISSRFGVIGVIVALLCCCAGFFLSYLAIFAFKRNVDFWDVVFGFDYGTFFLLMKKLFRPTTGIAYVISAILAYKFSFRKVNVKRYIETL
jgi:hypothetical protein